MLQLRKEFGRCEEVSFECQKRRRSEGLARSALPPSNISSEACPGTVLFVHRKGPDFLKCRYAGARWPNKIRIARLLRARRRRETDRERKCSWFCTQMARNP